MERDAALVAEADAVVLVVVALRIAVGPGSGPSSGIYLERQRVDRRFVRVLDHLLRRHDSAGANKNRDALERRVHSDVGGPSVAAVRPETVPAGAPQTNAPPDFRPLDPSVPHQ